MCVTFPLFFIFFFLRVCVCVCVNARVASAKSRTVGWANDRLTSTLSTPHHLWFFTHGCVCVDRRSSYCSIYNIFRFPSSLLLDSSSCRDEGNRWAMKGWEKKEVNLRNVWFDPENILEPSELVTRRVNVKTTAAKKKACANLATDSKTAPSGLGGHWENRTLSPRSSIYEGQKKQKTKLSCI